MTRTRTLVIVLGDQLDLEASAFDGFDATQDVVWMAEVADESTHVWSSKPRTALFLSAMRHFADALREVGKTVHYTRLDDAGNRGTLGAELGAAITRLGPQNLVMTAPGDWRVLHALKAVAAEHGLALDVRDDRHFYATVRDFAAHARGRKDLRLEYWYRELRRKHRVLMDDDAPVGGRWNYDSDNREAFGAEGPKGVPPRVGFAPDAITREVFVLVHDRFASHPGSLERFDWPVTRDDARIALARFVDARLAHFGPYQDAMWPNEPWLYHSHLAAAMNLKLLSAREVVDAAEAAWREGRAPLASVEGFIRQALGWREYVRVELPNTLGMSQYADGGLMGSKPYIASGRYIQRMSGYCRGCRFDPTERTGARACPFTTLYWDFLMRHEAMLTKNPRTVMQVKNLGRVDNAERERIRSQAETIRWHGVT